MAKIFIAGCGYVGSALGAELAQEGHEVWGLRRQPIPSSTGVNMLTGDLTRKDLLPHLPPNLDYVFYTAAAAQYNDEAYYNTYVVGLSNLLELLHQGSQNPKRIVYASSTAVYGQSNGEWVDETSATEPSHFSGKRLLEAESLLARDSYPTTSLRLGGIYGPSRSRLLDDILLGNIRLTENDTYTNRIHRDDCIRLLKHLITRENPDPVYIGVDNEPALHNEMVDWLSEILKVPLPDPDHNSAAPNRQRNNKRCSNRRLTDTGFDFRYPNFREGYLSILETTEIQGTA